MISLPEAIRLTRSGQDLSAEQMGHLIDTLLRGEAEQQGVGQLLLAIREKGEAVDELVGAARAMRHHMTPIPHRHGVLLDTCGTGGSGSGSFNISTATAIVTAACGVAVAKHGNRRATS
ncbi:MAG: anthranilate phosphoribosyltransferase, partial [Planctomycetaceae bacterium]